MRAEGRLDEADQMKAAMWIEYAGYTTGGVGIVKGTAGAAGKAVANSGIGRMLANDPARLPAIEMTDTGYINAQKVSIECRIIDLPKEVADMQSALLSAPNHKAAGDLREAISDSYFTNSGFIKLDGKCGEQCFDGVYLKHGEIYIVEVKPWKDNGAIQLNSASASGLPTQMTDMWINDRINYLFRHGSTEAKETATLIQEAIDRKRPINKIVIGIRHDSAITVNLGN